jgi:hypothetical protein
LRKRVIDKITHGFGGVGVVAAAAQVIEGMQPGPVIEKDPEGVIVEAAQIGDIGDEHVVDALLVKRASEMTVIKQVEAASWGPGQQESCAWPDRRRPL